MNLQPVPNIERGQAFCCTRCGKTIGRPFERGFDRWNTEAPATPVYADLDGEPFKAYYCERDAAEARATHTRSAS